MGCMSLNDFQTTAEKAFVQSTLKARNRKGGSSKTQVCFLPLIPAFKSWLPVPINFKNAQGIIGSWGIPFDSPQVVADCQYYTQIHYREVTSVSDGHGGRLNEIVDVVQKYERWTGFQIQTITGTGLPTQHGTSWEGGDLFSFQNQGADLTFNSMTPTVIDIDYSFQRNFGPDAASGNVRIELTGAYDPFPDLKFLMDQFDLDSKAYSSGTLPNGDQQRDVYFTTFDKVVGNHPLNNLFPNEIVLFNTWNLASRGLAGGWNGNISWPPGSYFDKILNLNFVLPEQGNGFWHSGYVKHLAGPPYITTPNGPVYHDSTFFPMLVRSRFQNSGSSLVLNADISDDPHFTSCIAGRDPNDGLRAGYLGHMTQKTVPSGSELKMGYSSSPGVFIYLPKGFPAGYVAGTVPDGTFTLPSN